MKELTTQTGIIVKCRKTAIEFGCYIQPDNYFVSYIFATDSQLETARRSGLTEQINSYHREQLIKRHYPIEGIKDCTFASQEE